MRAMSMTPMMPMMLMMLMLLMMPVMLAMAPVRVLEPAARMLEGWGECG